MPHKGYTRVSRKYPILKTLFKKYKNERQAFIARRNGADDLCGNSNCCGCFPTCVDKLICKQLQIYSRNMNEKEFKKIGIRNKFKKATFHLQKDPKWFRYAPYGNYKLCFKIMLKIKKIILEMLNSENGVLITLSAQYENSILFKFVQKVQKKGNKLMKNPNLSLYYIYTNVYRDKSAVAALNQAYNNRKINN